MLCNLVLASCTNIVSTIPMGQFAALQGLATLSLHFASIIEHNSEAKESIIILEL